MDFGRVRFFFWGLHNLDAGHFVSKGEMLLSRRMHDVGMCYASMLTSLFYVPVLPVDVSVLHNSRESFLISLS